MVQRIYRVEWTPETPEDKAVAWTELHRTAVEEAEGRTGVKVEVLEVPGTVKALLALLNKEAARMSQQPSVVRVEEHQEGSGNVAHRDDLASGVSDGPPSTKEEFG